MSQFFYFEYEDERTQLVCPKCLIRANSEEEASAIFEKKYPYLKGKMYYSEEIDKTFFDDENSDKILELAD